MPASRHVHRDWGRGRVFCGRNLRYRNLSTVPKELLGKLKALTML